MGALGIVLALAVAYLAGVVAGTIATNRRRDRHELSEVSFTFQPPPRPLTLDMIWEPGESDDKPTLH